MVRILLRMRSAFASANVSAQSPPCSRNASPRPAAASRSVRVSACAGTTMGAACASRPVAEASAAGSGQVGCWRASRVRKWSSPAGPADRSAGPVTTLIGSSFGSRPVVPARCSVLRGRGRLQRLADLGQDLPEPLLRDVEGLAAGDARERDGLEAVAVLLVVADDAGLAAQGALDRVV